MMLFDVSDHCLNRRTEFLRCVCEFSSVGVDAEDRIVGDKCIWRNCWVFELAGVSRYPARQPCLVDSESKVVRVASDRHSAAGIAPLIIHLLPIEPIPPLPTLPTPIRLRHTIRVVVRIRAQRRRKRCQPGFGRRLLHVRDHHAGVAKVILQLVVLLIKDARERLLRLSDRCSF